MVVLVVVWPEREMMMRARRSFSLLERDGAQLPALGDERWRAVCESAHDTTREVGHRVPQRGESVRESETESDTDSEFLAIRDDAGRSHALSRREETDTL